MIRATINRCGISNLKCGISILFSTLQSTELYTALKLNALVFTDGTCGTALCGGFLCNVTSITAVTADQLFRGMHFDLPPSVAPRSSLSSGGNEQTVLDTMHVSSELMLSMISMALDAKGHL